MKTQQDLKDKIDMLIVTTSLMGYNVKCKKHEFCKNTYIRISKPVTPILSNAVLNLSIGINETTDEIYEINLHCFGKIEEYFDTQEIDLTISIIGIDSTISTLETILKLF